MASIEWQLYPKNITCNTNLKNIIDVFQKHLNEIDSNNHQLASNDVLSIVTADLEAIGYKVEKSKLKSDKITVPVLYGRNGKLEKWFDADAYNFDEKTVIEVEAGRAVTNYQFLKDLFEATVMSNVDYCAIAVRNIYRESPDFEMVIQFMDTLYASNKLVLPLKGVLIIGY